MDKTDPEVFGDYGAKVPKKGCPYNSKIIAPIPAVFAHHSDFTSYCKDCHKKHRLRNIPSSGRLYQSKCPSCGWECKKKCSLLTDEAPRQKCFIPSQKVRKCSLLTDEAPRRKCFFPSRKVRKHLYKDDPLPKAQQEWHNYLWVKLDGVGPTTEWMQQTV